MQYARDGKEIPLYWRHDPLLEHKGWTIAMNYALGGFNPPVWTRHDPKLTVGGTKHGHKKVCTLISHVSPYDYKRHCKKLKFLDPYWFNGGDLYFNGHSLTVCDIKVNFTCHQPWTLGKTCDRDDCRICDVKTWNQRLNDVMFHKISTIEENELLRKNITTK